MGDTTTHLITPRVTSYSTIRIVTRLRMRGDDFHARPYVAAPFLAPVEQREKQGSTRLRPINYKKPLPTCKNPYGRHAKIFKIQGVDDLHKTQVCIGIGPLTISARPA